jgi:CheY-like chemotaxis protein
MKKILIIEDDTGVREAISFLISDPDTEISTASNGNEGIEILKNGFQGLIFMDVMMPGLTGWQTLQQIVDEGLIEGNFVCMLTACAPGVEGANLSKYVLDYVVKPFTQGQLQKVIELYSELSSEND